MARLGGRLKLWYEALFMLMRALATSKWVSWEGFT
jgi:hypothetical protein